MKLRDIAPFIVLYLERYLFSVSYHKQCFLFSDSNGDILGVAVVKEPKYKLQKAYFHVIAPKKHV